MSASGVPVLVSAERWRRFGLPAFTFMSVVIGGGYATGRELAEFFLPAGPIGGLLGMFVTAVIWSVIFALSLELARTTQSFEYRSFFRHLLGRAWIAFEIVYLALLVLVLAVLGAACGEIAGQLLSVPQWTGMLAFVGFLALLVWLGGGIIEDFFSLWGMLLYISYMVFLVACFVTFGDRIADAFEHRGAVQSGWLVGGLTYAGYNIAVAPALLSCARHQSRRSHTILAGMLAGPVAMLPGVMFYVAMMARYPEIGDAAIPLQVLLQALDMPWLSVGMQIVIFGTLVQTGIGVLHGFNERLLGGGAKASKVAVRPLRLAVSLAISVVAVFLAARIGVVGLIAKGYGFLSWVIIGVYALPLLTVGVWRICRSRD